MTAQNAIGAIEDVCQAFEGGQIKACNTFRKAQREDADADVIYFIVAESCEASYENAYL